MTIQEARECAIRVLEQAERDRLECCLDYPIGETIIETTEPAEASLTARIEVLARQYQQAVQWRQEALQTAQAHANTMLKLEGAIEELQRLKDEIWKKDDGQDL